MKQIMYASTPVGGHTENKKTVKQNTKAFFFVGFHNWRFYKSIGMIIYRYHCTPHICIYFKGKTIATYNVFPGP